MRDYTITQFANETGYSRARIYQLIAEGKMRAYRFGDLQCIPYSEARRIVKRVEKMGKYRTFKRVSSKKTEEQQ